MTHNCPGGGDTGDNLDRLKDALSKRPRWAQGHFQLAECLETLGDNAQAASSYRRAAELDPSLAERIQTPLVRLLQRLSDAMCRGTMRPPQQPVSTSSVAIYDADLAPASLCNRRPRLVAAACQDGTVHTYCTTTCTLVQVLRGHEQPVTTVRWSRYGHMLASGSLDNTACIWRQCTFDDAGEVWKCDEAPRAVLKGHTGRVSCVEFADDRLGSEDTELPRMLIVTASTDQTVRVWSADDGQCLHVLAGHSALVSDIALSPDYRMLVSASGDSIFKLWEPSGGRLVQDVAWDSGPVVLCGFLPGLQNHENDTTKHQAPLLLTAHAQLVRSEARVLLWDVMDRREGWVDNRLAAPAKAMDGLRGRPTAWDACWDQDGALLLAVTSSDGLGRIWDITDAPVSLFSFQLDGVGVQMAADVAHADMPAWRAASLAHASQSHHIVKFSHNGEFLVFTFWHRALSAGGMAVLRVEDGEQHAWTLIGHQGKVRAIEWLGPRELLSAGEDGILKVWKLE